MSDEKRIYDQATLAFRKLSPKDGDVIVISFPEDIEHAQMAAFAEGLQEHIPDDVCVLCARGDVKVEQLSEEVMNQMGWYRKTH